MESGIVSFRNRLLFVLLLATLALSATVGCASGAVPPEEAWNKAYGGANADKASSVLLTSDGGYIIAGFTHSYGAGYADFWLVKTDSNGNKEWDKTFGGSWGDIAYSVLQTSDGGYILAGKTMPYSTGYNDSWLVKTDSNGNKQWDKTFGGAGNDSACSVLQTADGGYVVTGWTELYGAGSCDFLLMKIDSSGTEEWNKTFGGTGYDSAYTIQRTIDGGYVLAGKTESYGAGSYDFWLVKTDSSGIEEWNNTFGGTEYDRGYSARQTSDGGYIFVGFTESYGAGSYDFWLVKVKGESPTISIYTDKTSYTAGDTMRLGLDVKNPLESAQRVNIGIWLEMPAYPWTYTLVNKPYFTLSSELEYSNRNFKVFPVPDLHPGTYVWRATIHGGEGVCTDTASWDFVPLLKGASTVEITEMLEQTPVVIDFDE